MEFKGVPAALGDGEPIIDITRFELKEEIWVRKGSKVWERYERDGGNEDTLLRFGGEESWIVEISDGLIALKAGDTNGEIWEALEIALFIFLLFSCWEYRPPQSACLLLRN